MSSAAKKIDYSEITEGMQVSHTYKISSEIYQGFLRLFEDRNPLHTDSEHAKKNGFTGPVMHGAILNGFLSHFIGMCFPGSQSVLLSVEMSYLKPNYLGDELTFHCEVSQRLESHSVLVLIIKIENLTQKSHSAKAKVQVKVLSQ